MVKEQIELVTVETICASCDDQLVPTDPAMFVVRYPAMRAEMLCLPCWLAIVASATCYLKGLAPPPNFAPGKRLAWAEDHCVKAKALRIVRSDP